MELLELIQERKARLDKIIPSKLEDAMYIELIQGKKYKNSTNPKVIIKSLIPLINSSLGIPTKTVVDSWLTDLANSDFKDTV
jgi:hypothetical protein